MQNSTDVPTYSTPTQYSSIQYNPPEIPHNENPQQATPNQPLLYHEPVMYAAQTNPYQSSQPMYIPSNEMVKPTSEDVSKSVKMFFFIGFVFPFSWIFLFFWKVYDKEDMYRMWAWKALSMLLLYCTLMFFVLFMIFVVDD
ncbi:hypothetical protein EIN_136550 [Entamoeba invadens IP1]|uniref:Uncharacterized protein n=1 Tax=Entamoeba invadens IP1 TaxID=370355 RepID=A0A0A1U0F6_ENTIV|nr:hypothetical protein EIN_136550 [Entamoeba invadens IP1]ELP85981.1 hypothetical protein EIN_136550 [Entamoeba invadens IP1]|eukprot:XP_004185327.1 hypothetical protein EIN_136550 [Entamoeba invadens IP1]